MCNPNVQYSPHFKEKFQHISLMQLLGTLLDPLSTTRNVRIRHTEIKDDDTGSPVIYEGMLATLLVNESSYIRWLLNLQVEYFFFPNDGEEGSSTFSIYVSGAM